MTATNETPSAICGSSAAKIARPPEAQKPIKPSLSSLVFGMDFRYSKEAIRSSLPSANTLLLPKEGILGTKIAT